MRPGDVEAIERATLAAVSPLEVLETDGWLAGLEDGVIRRARSAVPLRHEMTCDLAVLDRIEAAYLARDLAPAFRLADVPGLDDLRGELAARGYHGEQSTLVKRGAASGLLSLGASGEILDVPDDAWGRVFLGEGFDPVDGAGRVAALRRSPNAVFGRVRDGEETVAVGVMSFGFGWAGVHGMRTAKARRGQGLAGHVLAGLAAAAVRRGVERVFLQVEAANAPARALYARAGLTEAWRYCYWVR
jgi:ribosomal protein S18 acetylase RimI-like enzyme